MALNEPPRIAGTDAGTSAQSILRDSVKAAAGMNTLGPAPLEGLDRRRETAEREAVRRQPRVTLITRGGEEEEKLADQVKETPSRARAAGLAVFSRPIDIYNAKGDFPAPRSFQMVRPPRGRPLLSFSLSHDETLEEAGANLSPAYQGRLLASFQTPLSQLVRGRLVDNLV